MRTRALAEWGATELTQGQEQHGPPSFQGTVEKATMEKATIEKATMEKATIEKVTIEKVPVRPAPCLPAPKSFSVAVHDLYYYARLPPPPLA